MRAGVMTRRGNTRMGMPGVAVRGATNVFATVLMRNGCMEIRATLVGSVFILKRCVIIGFADADAVAFGALTDLATGADLIVGVDFTVGAVLTVGFCCNGAIRSSLFSC